jgi:hypothetical protein
MLSLQPTLAVDGNGLQEFRRLARRPDLRQVAPSCDPEAPQVFHDLTPQFSAVAHADPLRLTSLAEWGSTGDRPQAVGMLLAPRTRHLLYG